MCVAWRPHRHFILLLFLDIQWSTINKKNFLAYRERSRSDAADDHAIAAPRTAHGRRSTASLVGRQDNGGAPAREISARREISPEAPQSVPSAALARHPPEEAPDGPAGADLKT